MKLFQAIRSTSDFLMLKLRYLEIFHLAGQKELDPTWLKDRYGTVFSHAFLVAARLFLFVGLAAIIDVFVPDNYSEMFIPGRQSVEMIHEYDTEDSVLDSVLWLEKERLKKLHDELQSNLPDEADRTRRAKGDLRNESDEPVYGQQHEWFLLPTELATPERKNVLSIVDPVFAEKYQISPPETQTPTCRYPVNFTADQPAYLSEFRELIFEKEKVGDLWTHEIDVLVNTTRSTDEFISPGQLKISLTRDSESATAKKDWKIESVQLSEDRHLRRNATLVYMKAGIEDSFVQNWKVSSFERYTGKVQSIEDEVQRLVELPTPNSFISKVAYVATYVLTSILCSFLMALACVIIGQKSDERSLVEVFQICSHLLLPATGAYCVAYLLFFNHIPIQYVFTTTGSLWFDLLKVLAVVLLLVLPTLLYMRFFLNQFSLQVTAACRYPVLWEANSRFFGLRRARSFPSIAFRMVAFGIFTLFLFTTFKANYYEAQLDLLLFELSLHFSS